MSYRPLPKEVRLGFSDIEGLGGFINHADVPNCYKTALRYTQEDDSKIHYKIWNLIALDDIKEGEELTVTYTFYKL